MPTLTIRECQSTTSGFAATLSIDNQVQYDITVHDPFDGKQERELEFYFEEWIRFPFDNQVIADRAAQSVRTYGERLFEQIFENRRAYSAYERACQEGLSQLRIEIIGESPEFQALHWEALQDPDLPRPFAVDCIMTRKRFQERASELAVKPSPVINLLVVTARPDEESDVGYRTISRPLIDAIHQAQLRVNVELLRPGTFEALSKHLEAKEGYYHIIHFDAHGGLMTHEQYQKGVKSDRYVFQARYGRSDMKRYDGVKAFLFLEGDTKGKADPVEAEELAKLLTRKGIPICILNACQSGKQVRSSLAPQPLNLGGLPTTQSPPDMGDLGGTPPDLGNLGGTPPDLGDLGGTPPDLGDLGGKTLEQQADTKGEGIDIRETSLGSRLMAAGVQMVVAMGYSVTVTAAALMMETLYSQLFAQKGIPEAIRLGRKELYNRKGRKVYFNQVVDLEDWLLPVVYANGEVDLRLQEFSPREKAEYLMQRRQRYRFESPTYGFVGRDLEILKIEKALLRHNVLLLRGMGGTGKTTLLNYLREWWQTTHFVKDVFYFGYDRSAHTLQHILRVIGKGLYPDPYDFAAFEAMPIAAQMEDLAEQLRANPYGLMLDNLESVTGQALAIQNTLPETEREVIREFLKLLRGGKTRVLLGSRSGEEWLADVFTFDGNPNIYPLGGLDPESRSVLAEKILAAQVKDPQRIARLRTDDGFKQLMKLLAGYPLAMEVVLANLARQSPQEILTALQGAEVDLNVGGEDKTNNILKCVEYSHSNLSADAQTLLLCLAPFNSFFVRDFMPQYAEQLKQHVAFQNYDFEHFDVAIQEAINWGLLSPHESGIPGFLTIQPIFPYFLRTKLNALDATTREALYDGFKAHYQSLARSYQQLMDSKDPNQRQLGILFCRLEYENLYSALQICLKNQESIRIYRCLDQYLDLIGDIQTKLKLSQHICEASKNYQPEVLTGEIGYEIAEAFLKIGVCYLQVKDYDSARSSHQKSVDLLEKNTVIAQNNKQLAIATNYHQLGYVAQELREYEQARTHYQQALDIFIEFGDRYSQARTYHQLGRVAEELREYEQARTHYQQALDIKIEFGDRYSQASTYHQLGRVAEELREYEQARTHYQQALDIYIEFGDRYEQAGTYHQLGRVAEELREYEQARTHYQQALDIYIEFGDRYSQARTYHQLGSVAQALREYEQARTHYQQALDIYIEFGDRYEQAGTYHQLGSVAQAMREYEQARTHYQQALDIFIEFGDRYSQASTYGQLGLLAEAQEDYEQAQQHLQQALVIFVEFGDEYSVGMTLQNLARLYQTTQDEGILTAVAQCLNATVDEVSQLFETLNRDE
ncbi:tetratricopeptide repeat protein [Oscillatoria sp. FACHB-1407]|uniref:tetratricopeptide repeat protein n=1 Tax=Oscillatoria sp. FACHB-1407 TaxID=2692847 RepID=UPI001689B7F8|nr:tetratricopeptide repeat protein [Oscillatoria sp. FACHB-1407]MBD2463714.1 tetratricopeptide repeat protein [Oscillatoria sp. FACHB-1407]